MYVPQQTRYLVSYRISRDHSPLTDPLRLSMPSRYPDMCILLYRQQGPLRRH